MRWKKGLDVSDNLDEAGLEALDKAVKGEEMGRNFRKQETENESSEKELSSEENVKEESHEETTASDESTTENH